MNNLGRAVLIIVTVLVAWYFWPQAPRPIGQVLLADLRAEGVPDPNRPLVLALDPPVRLAAELLREAEAFGPCSGKRCGAVDPVSRRIMIGKVCDGEKDCVHFEVPDLPGLYVLGRVWSVDDGRTLAEAFESRFVGRSLATTTGEMVSVRRVFAVDVRR